MLFYLKHKYKKNIKQKIILKKQYVNGCEKSVIYGKWGKLVLFLDI